MVWRTEPVFRSHGYVAEIVMLFELIVTQLVTPLNNDL